MSADADESEVTGAERATGGRHNPSQNSALRAYEREERTRRIKMPDGWDAGAGAHGNAHRDGRQQGEMIDVQHRRPSGRYLRNFEPASLTVWEFPAVGYRGAHFATFPPELAQRCVLAGCPVGGMVLDPFGGAGTTGLVALRHGRKATLIELNPKSAHMAQRRIEEDFMGEEERRLSRGREAAVPVEQAGPLFDKEAAA